MAWALAAWNTHRDPEALRQMPWPEAVIVAGLGEEGKLHAVDLIQTVRRLRLHGHNG